ncbi:hypothetical protein RN001_004249 [Aquatica leii]|uniref:Spaetzle domain-containing protein n=1 Tax=Aquatica leii TaxID=1421715 RepID=A0AAN7P535_9COLE|nr:hypothetical protein RN001_004249 [Aquatica leii]
MGNFIKFAVLIICIAITNAIRHRRPQIASHHIEFNFKEKIQQSHDFKKFFDQRNLAETDDCIYHLCSNITNYPQYNIRSIIEKKKEFHNLFGPVIQPYEPPKLTGKSPSIIQGFEEKNMCATRQYTHYPQTALNKYRKRTVIVNVDDFRQAVSFEICLPNAKCFMDAHKPLHYETSCKQQFTLIRLVAVEENGNVILDKHIDDDLQMRQRKNSSAIALDAFPSPSTTFTSTRQEIDDYSKG